MKITKHTQLLLIALMLSFGILAQTPQVDFSKSEEALNKNRQQKCEVKIKRIQKKVDKITARLETKSTKTKNLSWNSWRVNTMNNRLERLRFRSQINCPPASTSLATANSTLSVPCNRCMRVGNCDCNGNRISYLPCELYAEITKNTFIKAKMIKEYTVLDYFAFKELRRVINDTLRKLRKEVKLNALAKDLNLTRKGDTILTGAEKARTGKQDKNPGAPVTSTDKPAPNTQTVEPKEEITRAIIHFEQDSTDLANCFIGGQGFNMGSITVFQNFDKMPDDNPKDFTQFNFNYSLPLKKLNGKMVCNYRKPYAFVWFRNLYFASVLTPATIASNQFAAQGLDTTFNNKKSVYVNFLDLYQYSRLRARINFNILTYTSRYYSFYGNLHAGVARTEVKYGTEKSANVNYYDYGYNLSLRTKFKMPLNLVCSYHFFFLDANSDVVSPNLNPKYSNIYKSDNTLYRYETRASQFSAFNVTFQYDLRSINTNDDPGSGNKNSNSPTFVYASISYNTNRMFGARYNQQAHNNFLTIQVGYSRSFEELAKSLKSLVGLDKGSETSTAAVEK